jgi:hypothetical protein
MLNILRNTPNVRLASAGLFASFFISAATSGRFTLCRLHGGLGQFDLCHDDALETPVVRSHMGAMRIKARASCRKHRHMMDAPNLLINLLYRTLAQSSGLPG